MIISVIDLSKTYYIKPQLFKAGGLFGIQSTDFALKDINFEISKGECVGIIGKNGSGKSTLLKLLCGITSPTKGEISVDGRISALLELGTGFNPEYTGISNIYLNGAVSGLSKKEIKAILPEILSFADIGDYIYKPVKTYSDGMFLRLAFACAISLSPDVLIIDEALAVGDFAFRRKCFSKIESMKKSGATILIVSHDIDSIRKLCSRTIWLDNGTLRMDGDTASVSAAYMEHMTGCAELSLPAADFAKQDSSYYLNRFGSAIGAVREIQIPCMLQTGSEYEIRCELDIPEGADLDNLAFSVSFKNSFGLDLTVISSSDCGIKFTKHGECVIKVKFLCQLCAGEYSLCVSLESRAENPIKYYDYAEGIDTIHVVSEKESFGIFRTEAEITVDYGAEC